MNEELCESLQPILKLELARGNEIESINVMSWTNCSYAVNLKNKMDHASVSNLALPETVQKWECQDSHYSLQSGYSCSKSKHSIAGPL